MNENENFIFKKLNLDDSILSFPSDYDYNETKYNITMTSSSSSKQLPIKFSPCKDSINETWRNNDYENKNINENLIYKCFNLDNSLLLFSQDSDFNATKPYSTRKRGRKPLCDKMKNNFNKQKKRKREREHRNDDKDNVIGTIKTHFKNKCLLKFLDYQIVEEYNRQKVRFRNFTFDTKNKEIMRDFMEKTIYEICQNPISGIYRNCLENQNLKSLKNIHDEKIIKMKVKDIYNDYYLNKDLHNILNPKNNNKIENLYDFINKAKDEKLKLRRKKIGETLISEFISVKSNNGIDKIEEN